MAAATSRNPPSGLSRLKPPRTLTSTPMPALTRDLVVTVLAPVAIGMFVRARWPETAGRLAAPIEKVSTILLTALLALMTGLIATLLFRYD